MPGATNSAIAPVDDEEQRRLLESLAPPVPGITASKDDGMTPDQGVQTVQGDEGHGTDRFTNFSRIFNANAQGTANYANKLSGNLISEGQRTNKAINDAGKDYTRRVNANTVGFGGETIKDAPHSTQAPKMVPSTDRVRDTNNPSNLNRKLDQLAGDPQGQPPAPAPAPTGGSTTPAAPGQEPGTITPEQANERSNHTYTSPVKAGSPELEALAGTTAENSNAVADQGQRQALLAKRGDVTFGNSMGGALDSALLGGASNNRFQNIKKAFGGTDKAYQDMVTEGEGEDSDAKKISEMNAGRYKTLLDKFNYDKAHAGDRAKARASGTKKGSFEDYLDPDKAYWVQKVAQNPILNPIDAGFHALGLKSPMDTMTTQYEEGNGTMARGIDHPLGNADKAIDAFNDARTQLGLDVQSIYASMTPAEVANLETLGKADQMKWLADRAAKLKENPDYWSGEGE